MKRPDSSPAVPADDAHPRGGRAVAWIGFVFGSVISTAGNVLYTWIPPETAGPDWRPSITAQLFAAVWPIALLISVEVLSRSRWAPGLQWSLARYGGTGVVALGSAIISYGHLHGVLDAWGYGDLGSAVGPLVLDGLMTVSGFALLSPSTPADLRATTETAGPTGDRDPLLNDFVQWAADLSAPPSQRAVRARFGVGADRARDLLAAAAEVAS